MKHAPKALAAIVVGLTGVAVAVGVWFLNREPAAAETTVAPKAADVWEVTYIGPQRVGYSHLVVRPIERDGRELLETTLDLQLNFRRFGQETVMQTRLDTIETTDGELRSFRYELRNPPADTSVTAGEVRGDKLVLTTQTGTRTETKTQDWEAGAKSPTWQERTFLVDSPAADETRSFRVYLPELNQFTDVKAEVLGNDLEPMLDGDRRELLQVRITRGDLPAPLEAWLDDKGRLVKTSLPYLGRTLATYRVGRDTALKKIAGADLDLGLDITVKTGPIPDVHRTAQVVYEVTIPGGKPAELLRGEPYQQVKSLNADTARVTVSQVRPAGRAEPVEKIDSEFLAATRFLQADDPLVREHAAKAAGDAREPAEVAVRLERYVHELLSDKNFSTALASAAEVARSREGDCTEHAVLLAALLRCREIPSRIAAGLVYVETLQGFGAHMWTEAYLNGRWVPLDATIGIGGTGAGHLKLAESSFADDAPAPVTAFLPLMGVLGRVQIEVVDTP